MHTTISVLEGLRLLELHRVTGVRALRAAQRRAQEFLLAHRLFRSHRTGAVIKSEFTRLEFPPRWHYDILRAGGVRTQPHSSHGLSGAAGHVRKTVQDTLAPKAILHR